jgi:2-polyprenyl-3-methyl-5-hydroxy-6-metoxy-1,4-benzoquinol methylase
MNPSPIDSPVEGQKSMFDQEVTTGERFQFGQNWKVFLANLTPERINQAELSLKSMLEVDSLAGKTFLDAGSGSGLFSLAARRLGAVVCSFDYDPDSVACASFVKELYFPNDPQWRIETGSVLDSGFLSSLGQFDIVYSWGVLHHTGAMYKALDLVAGLVKPNGGKLFIAIYNDQGLQSKIWHWVKKTYCKAPAVIKSIILLAAAIPLRGPAVIRDFFLLLSFHNPRNYSNKNRGMSPWRDMVDWVGGYPFEVASPEEIFDFYFKRGFSLTKLITVGGKLGNNQFVFALNRP